MQMCEGVVVIVDREAIIFTRIWCGFEQAMVIQGEQLLLDFATIHSGEAQVLTAGFAHKLEAREMKAARERGFPLEVMEKGIDKIDITKANASREDDRRHILNSISKRDLDAEPDLSSIEFTPGLKDTVPERPYHSNLCTSEFH